MCKRVLIKTAEPETLVQQTIQVGPSARLVVLRIQDLFLTAKIFDGFLSVDVSGTKFDCPDGVKMLESALPSASYIEEDAVQSISPDIQDTIEGVLEMQHQPDSRHFSFKRMMRDIFGKKKI